MEVVEVVGVYELLCSGVGGVGVDLAVLWWCRWWGRGEGGGVVKGLGWWWW